MSEPEPDAGCGPDQARARRSFDQIERVFEDRSREQEPDVRFGVAYWIPDDESGIDTRRAHPWVITRPPMPGDPVVVASPRTTSRRRASSFDLLTPGGLLPELDDEGWVLVTWSRRFPRRNFVGYRIIGRLPQEWLGKLRAAIDAHARTIR